MKPDPNRFGPRDLQRALSLSDATRLRLERYAALLEKWQPRINLVGPKTLPEVWWRHFYDSAQLLALLPEGTRTLVDLGSGAGFPGLVLAILGIPEVHLIESDQRKAAFLREVSRETSAPATIHAVRVEAVAPFQADAVTARALAPLAKLLPMAERFCGPKTLCLFPKGQDVDEELTLATNYTTLRVIRQPSQTDSRGTILLIEGISRAQGRS